MTISRLAIASLGAALTLSAAPCVAQTQTAPPAGVVEPQAREALQRMGAYLATLTAFEIKTETSLDLVTNEGQRVQLDGGAHYKVQRPKGFAIEVATDMKDRRFVYDGKQLTVVSPKRGYYASAPMSGTNREVINQMAERYGINLPLEDLFSWSEPGGVRADRLTSGYLVGPATIDGVQTDHYAFREAAADWQVWIQKGDQPLPRKLVIVDRSDPAFPAYSARLNWTVNPTLNAADFAYVPGQGAKQIRLNILDR